MHNNFDKHYEYLINFLDTGIKHNKLSQSIIFEGDDILMQYALALETARKLNCLEEKNSDCTCRNCNWIRENKHPAVLTVSKIDNKTDTSTTVISLEQLNTILNTLINPSEFERVYIFCDANMKQLTESEKKRYEMFSRFHFKAPGEETGKSAWYPDGLTEKCFQIYAQNAMLKSIEEPPQHVTFIFLTKNKNDLLPTIVSRSQSFMVPSLEMTEFDTTFYENELKYYPEFSGDKALTLVRNIMKYQNENDYTTIYLLDCMQEYIKKVLKANLTNTILVNKIYRDLEKIENSKRMIKAHIKDNVVLEDLAFYLANRN